VPFSLIFALKILEVLGIRYGLSKKFARFENVSTGLAYDSSNITVG